MPASSAHQFYRVEGAASEEATVYIYDAIGRNLFEEGVGAEAFVRDLQKIQARTINLRINSPGGNVFEANAIANALVRHPARVVAHVDGIAASAASYVALAADEVRITDGAFFMIHNAHGGALGDAAMMRKVADTLDKVTASIRDRYVAKTGRSAEAIQAWMDEEKWFTAAEAKAAGLADAIDDNAPVRAEFDLAVFNFKHLPEEIAARAVPAPDRAPTERDAERALREAGFSNAAAKAIIARGYKATPEPRDEDGELAELIPALEARGQTLATATR